MAVTGPTKVATWGTQRAFTVLPARLPPQAAPGALLLDSPLDSWGRTGFQDGSSVGPDGAEKRLVCGVSSLLSGARVHPSSGFAFKERPGWPELPEATEAQKQQCTWVWQVAGGCTRGPDGGMWRDSDGVGMWGCSGG